MNREMFMLLTISGLFAAGFWWYVNDHRGLMDQSSMASAFLIVTFLFGPLAGIGTIASGIQLFQSGWKSAWYTVPAMLAGGTGFVVNGLAFIVFFAPSC